MPRRQGFPAASSPPSCPLVWVHHVLRESCVPPDVLCTAMERCAAQTVCVMCLTNPATTPLPPRYRLRVLRARAPACCSAGEWQPCRRTAQRPRCCSTPHANVGPNEPQKSVPAARAPASLT